MTLEGEFGRGCRRCLVALTLMVLAFTAGACGGDGESADEAAERDAVARTIQALQDSFEVRDWRRLCEHMDPAARIQAGEVAHGRPGACPQDLDEAFETIDAGGGMRQTRASKLIDVAVAGDRATATLAVGRHGRVAVPLVRGGSGWRLATFFGTPPRRAAGYAADRSAEVLPGGGAVAVAEQGGASCFELFEDDYPRVAGGCVLGASGRITLTIGTVFGHFEFGECAFSYRVLADGQGRAWTDSVSLSAPDSANNGCSDVRGCENADGEPLPWGSRLSATDDGRILHRMRVCFDTCIGSYAGPLVVTLANRRRGWKGVAANGGVGGSGLRFDGRIDLFADGIELGPASG